MKNPVPPLVVFSGLLGTVLAAPPTPDYELLYAEEFEGTRVNEADWTFREGRRTVGSYVNGLNFARNVSVSEGSLRVAVRQEMIDGVVEHTGGGVISTHRFGFGYYECRSKPFMAGRGVHSAFWQRGAGENNSFFEIDSYELDSTETIATNNLYVDLSPVKGGLPWPHRAHVPLKLPADGWWVDAYEYTPEGVIFYDHGVKVAEAEFPDLIGQQNIWLTALNGVRGIEADKQPGESLFDYFRYYAKDYPGMNLLPNGSFEYNVGKPLTAPIAWKETGDVDASIVAASGTASHGDHVLRHAADRPWRVTTSQKLEFIRNGEYELLARVRRKGREAEGRITVTGAGSEPQSVVVPVSAQWQLLHLKKVLVATHCATIEVSSSGSAGDWLEVDDIQFMKPPLPNQARRPSRVLGKVDESREPRWQIGQRVPLTFVGDDRFYFFSRNVGQGDAATVALELTVPSLTDTIPISRQPREGTGGWALRLSASGDVAFCVGSKETNREIVARGVLRPNTPARVAAVFDRGTARLYVDGVLRASATGLQVTPTSGEVGRLGASQNAYQVADDIMLATSEGEARRAATPRLRNFVGLVRDLRIYNCALEDERIPVGTTSP